MQGPAAPLTPVRTSRFRDLISFLGRRVVLLLAVGILIGASQFSMEAGFAAAIQAFFLCLGIMKLGSAGRLAHLVSALSLPVVLSALFVIGLLRALFYWAQVYTQGAAAEEFRHLQRSRVLRWAFKSESLSTAETLLLFGDKVVGGSTAINNLQGLVVQLTDLGMILCSLFWLSPPLSVIVLAALALMFAPLRRADRMIMESGKDQESAIKVSSQGLIASIKNLLLIQIYGTQDIEQRKSQAALEAHRGQALRLAKLIGFKHALPQFVGMLLICAITAAARSHARMSSGALVSYFYLLVRLLQGLTTMNSSFAGIMASWTQSALLYRWWEQNAHDGPNPPKGTTPDLAPRRGDEEPVGWELRGVGFTYPDGGKPVLSGVDLRLEPGQALVVTGPSGAGKSTLLGLLLGYHKPDRGSIDTVLSGGRSRPLREFRDELLPLIGYVGPENFMLEGCIFDNLIYGLESQPPYEEIWAALDKAECGFVRELPKKLAHSLTEQGQGLSAGQKQRLALARALLRRPKVIILDEATSNLDGETEERLVDTLARLKGEMTIIAVTHRKALLRIADRQLSL